MKEIITMIRENKIKFEKLIATPDVMNELKSFAKVLGPKGLMPNIKGGTLVSIDALGTNRYNINRVGH
jgi:large subunit ribosomal protein L1